MTIRVSVVVPTYRRPLLLERCLQALLTQHLDPTRYEIIVVIDGSEDEGSRAVIEKYQDHLWANPLLLPVTGASATPKKNGHRQAVTFQVERQAASELTIEVETRVVAPILRCLQSPQSQGPAAARNLGWRSARGDIIAFTDDDTLPDPGWLGSGLAAFTGDVAGVSGQVIVPLPPNPTDHELNTTGLERSLFVTANCFYHKEALQAANGFDERFRAAWREDSDLFFTLREQGLLLVTAPEAVVIHPPRPAPWGSSIQAQQKSIYNALLFKKHPRLYREIIQSSSPWHYYIILAALLVAVVTGLASMPLISALSIAFWAGMIANLSLHRLERTSHAPSHVLEMIVTSMLIPPLSIFWRLRGALRYRVFFL